MFLTRSRTTVLAVTAFLLVTMLTGCGGGLAALLKITGATALLPDRWTSHGGIVKILVNIISDSIIDKVVARIKHEASSAVTEVILTRNADGQYEGSFSAPANTDPVAPETYTAVVEASDTAGNTATSEPVTVEVPPAQDPVPAQ
jgi:hypothetical protein